MNTLSYAFFMADTNDITLKKAKESYIAQWGILGSCWGINRTMAQIHALLMVSADSLSTDQIMQELQISRGNAHSNIKELVSWQLLRPITKKGDRKEYFEAEKDSMKIFAHVARERRRREIEPVIQFLEQTLAECKDLKGAEAKAFKKQLNDLLEFTQLGDRAMSKFSKMGQGQLLKWVLKFV